METRRTPVIPVEALTNTQILDMIDTYETYGGHQETRGLPPAQFYAIRDTCIAALVQAAYQRGLLQRVRD